jgi:tRNA threonylcarbamoyladenosine biosynthesis protein TsaB
MSGKDPGGRVVPDAREGAAPGAERFLLAIDSSTSRGSVAIGNAAGVLSEIYLTVRATHSSALLPAIDRALRSSSLSPGDLGGVVVGAGPGSFTGIRIAAAMAKGIVRALGIPMYAYSSLLAAAAQASAASGMVCAVFDARGRDVYAAAYDFRSDVEVLIPPTACTIDDVVERLRDLDALLFVGDGAIRHRSELEAAGGRVAPPHFGHPGGGALIWLAVAEPMWGLVDDPAAWEPSYLRASGAERIAAARAAGDTR